MVERVHARIMMRGGWRGGGQMCVVERVHARIIMRGGGEGICVWWRSACENNDVRRREGEDNVCGGESVCENNDERRGRGRTMCVMEKCMRE